MNGCEFSFGSSTARRLMALARHPMLSNTTHGSLLPRYGEARRREHP